MKGNNNKKKMNSIFDNCHETASQEIFLRSCGFAQRDALPDSDPSVLGVSQPPPPLNNGINSGYEVEELVESHVVRFVSPPESPRSVDSEEEDRTVPVESGNLLMASTPEKKVKVPLRDVVKAIVMNSRSAEEDGEDRDVEKKRSCVQVLIEKGFNFN